MGSGRRSTNHGSMHMRSVANGSGGVVYQSPYLRLRDFKGWARRGSKDEVAGDGRLSR